MKIFRLSLDGEFLDIFSFHKISKSKPRSKRLHGVKAYRLIFIKLMEAFIKSQVLEISDMES